MGWCDVAPAHRFFGVVQWRRYEDSVLAARAFAVLAARAFASGPSEKVGLTTGSSEVSRAGADSAAWGWENKLEESMGMSLVKRKYCGYERRSNQHAECFHVLKIESANTIGPFSTVHLRPVGAHRDLVAAGRGASRRDGHSRGALPRTCSSSSSNSKWSANSHRSSMS
jgi:hypothetical protein